MKGLKKWFVNCGMSRKSLHKRRVIELETECDAIGVVLTSVLQSIAVLESMVKKQEKELHETIEVVKNNEKVDKIKLKIISGGQKSMLEFITVEREKLNSLEEKLDYLQIKVVESHDDKIKVLECVVDDMNNPTGVANENLLEMIDKLQTIFNEQMNMHDERLKMS